MSGHETIRVLEVGVDAPAQSEENGKPLDLPVSEPTSTNDPPRETVLCHTDNTCAETTGTKFLLKKLVEIMQLVYIVIQTAIIFLPFLKQNSGSWTEL